jgi:hypothetical protein
LEAKPTIDVTKAVTTQPESTKPVVTSEKSVSGPTTSTDTPSKEAAKPSAGTPVKKIKTPGSRLAGAIKKASDDVSSAASDLGKAFKRDRGVKAPAASSPSEDKPSESKASTQKDSKSAD